MIGHRFLPILGIFCLVIFVFFKLNKPKLIDVIGETHSLEKVSKAHAPITKEASAIVSFDEWLDNVAILSSKSNDWTQAEWDAGIKMAHQRGEAMRELMRQNPDAALKSALSYQQYAKLPPEIQALVEEPFSDKGTLEVFISCGGGHHSEMDYSLQNDEGENWQVFLPEHERIGLSKVGIPLQGIRLDGIAVIRGPVFQILKDEEAKFASEHWPSGQIDPSLSYVSGTPIHGDGLIATSGGRVFHFQNESELQKLEAALREADQLPGLDVGSQWILREVSSDGFPFQQFSEGMASAAYNTTTGAKTALFILVSFPDSPSSPISASTLEQVVDINVNDALVDYSYGNTSMDADVYAGPVQVISNGGDYLGDTNNDGIQDTPKNQRDLYDEAVSGYMTATGLADPSYTYDTVAVYFTDIGYPWSGLASVGGQRMWIENTLSDEVILHEFGHNYGLLHANYWIYDNTNAASVNPVDPSGADEKYGDDFDVMGNGSTTQGHFHMAAKQFLGWIGNSDWVDLSSNSENGTYRIYRFDDGGSSGLQALRIRKSDTNDHYWVGYRNNYESLNTFTKGAYITWERAGEYGNTSRNKSWLIDTTPGSTNGKNDAPITLGRTYSDSSSDVHITPIAVGGSTPTEYIDVVINFGPFPGNKTPSGSIHGPTTTNARQLVLFSARVTDFDGDALAFAWEMGDGSIKDSSPSITHSWNSGGTYQVNLTVSDMKGGSVSLSKSVTVSDPLSTWNTRTSGTTAQLWGIAANDTHLVVVGDDGAILRSSEGTTWNDVSPSGYISNIKFNDIIWTGSEFIAVGEDYDFGISPNGWEGVVYTSPKGQTWTRNYETDTADTGLYGVAHGGSSTAVAVGESATIIRKSGTGTWGSVSTNILSTHILRDIAYGGGKFVLIGHATTPSYNGDVEVRSSSDALIWTDYSNNTGLDTWQDFREIEYLGDAFHAGGFYGRARRSKDGGQNWITTQSGDRYGLLGYAETNGVYYSVGVNNSNNNSDVDLVSNNGITWTEVLPGTLPNRRELIAYKGTFISVGDGGSIRQSDTIKASFGYDSFAATYFPGGGSDAADDSNPDFDWASNLIEYALGGYPDNNADAPDQPIMYFDSSNYAVFEITREQIQQDIAYSVWWSQNLTTWTQAGLIVVEDTEMTLKVRTEQTFDQQEKAFFRLQVDR